MKKKSPRPAKPSVVRLGPEQRRTRLYKAAYKMGMRLANQGRPLPAILPDGTLKMPPLRGPRISPSAPTPPELKDLRKQLKPDGSGPEESPEPQGTEEPDQTPDESPP